MESSVGLDRDSLHEAAHQTAEDIYSHARACEFLFTEYLQPSESLRIYHNKVHEYERRFLLWASFLGVFASEGTSLDERLQYAPETKELVLSMLQVLQRNLKRGIIRHLINPAMGPSIEVPKSDGILYGITGSIDRLHRLAIAMQYPPRTDKVDRVRNFASKQAPDDFYDLILTRLEYVFPSAEKTLRAQLAESIVYRRHSLLWTRRSSTMLVRQRVEKTENRPVEKEQEKASRSSKFGDDPHAGSTQQDSISGASNRGVLSSGQPSQLLQRADENSYHDQIVGQEDNHSSCSSNSLPKARYPDPPLAGGDEERLVCEYCLQEIQLPLGGTDKARNAVWRAHIDKDLRPYVCISEQCRGFPVDFSNVKEWKAHMQNAHHADWVQFVHRVTWQCPHCNDNFMTKELLHNHLTENHQKHYATSPDPLELAKDIIRSETTRFRAADECPLCGPPPWNEQDSQQKDGPSGTLPNDLRGHFVGHLQCLAMLSLSWWNDDISSEVAPINNFAVGFNSKKDDSQSLGNASSITNSPGAQSLYHLDEPPHNPDQAVNFRGKHGVRYSQLDDVLRGAQEKKRAMQGQQEPVCGFNQGNSANFKGHGDVNISNGPGTDADVGNYKALLNSLRFN